jgi:hypothetical protein
MENCNAGFITDRGRLFTQNVSAKKLDVEHCFHVKKLSGNSTEFWLSAKNISGSLLEIKKIIMFDGIMEVSGKAWEVLHGEFFKKEEYFNGFSYYSGNLIMPLKEVRGIYGNSEDTPFPGIFFMHPEHGNVFISVLSQEKCKPCWTFDGNGGLRGEDSFSGIPHIELMPCETFNSEHWLLSVSEGKIEDIIDGYYGLLKERYEFPGATSPLREEVVWGSWNYNERQGGHGDITHDYIIANAKAMSENFKKVRWIMIDDGYQNGVDTKRKGDIIGIDTFHNSLNPHYSNTRFPHGMRGVVQGIEDTGLKSAIWSSPVIVQDSILAQENPEWLLKFSGGKKFFGKSAYLDYSIPEVREYVKTAWNIIFNDWGFKGLKCDFWTPAFEIPEIEYKNKDMTAVQLRNMFLKDIYDFKPDGGFLITCCTINAGNPFIGIYADASRNGDDIGVGDWSFICRCAQWLSVSSLFYRGDCLLADADSIGWNHRISENENRLWATIAMMTGGMCEIGGDMTNLNQEKKKFFDTVTDFLKPSKKCVHNLLSSGVGRLPVTRCRLERNDTSFDAYLNWHDLPNEVNIDIAGRDLWTGKLCSQGSRRQEKHMPLCIKNN